MPKSLFKPRFLTLNIKIARFIHPAINEANSLDSDYLSKDNYDIVINGGGIVGFSMFAAIKCSPFLSSKRVLLIEQQSKPRFPDEDLESNERKFSNRVSSITLSSKQFFEELKIWHTLQPYAKKVQGMYVWSDHYQNGVNFTSDTFTDSICYVLENNRMLKALYNRITENNEEQNDDSLQKILYKTSVIDIDQTIDIENKTPSIQLKILDITDPEQKSKYIRTKLLIGCDGFKSIVRLKSGLPYFEMDLDQMGIVATMKIVSHNPGNHIAYQRFISDQLVIALLPLDEHHSSLVLSVPKKCAADWMKIPDKEFVSKLNNELIRETVVQKPLDKLSSAFNLKQLYNIIQIKSPPTIESIVSGSRASFPLGFGTTVPFMVGTIEPKVPLMKALISKDKRVNTAIIGKETNYLNDNLHLNLR